MRPVGGPILVSHVITRLVVGGAQENTIATVLGMQNKPGLRCDLISGPTTGREGSLESEFDSRAELLTVAPHLVRDVRPLTEVRAAWELRGIFRRTKPAIVHTHSGKAGILGRWAAHRERVPIIVHTIHGPSFGPWQGGLANVLFRGAERFADPMTTHFVAVAQAMIDQYLAAGIGSPDRCTRIFSGFPLASYLASRPDPVLRARYGLAPGHFVIGKIARITELKGHDDLLAIAPELVRRHPNARFLLIGGGDLEDSFRGKVRAAGLDRFFVFTGLVPPAEIPALAGIIDMLAHLSLREGLPRALPQALAAGKPVAAYDCDGAREVCLNEQTGILVKPGDRSGLLQALDRFANDPAFRSRLGEQGRAFVRERFSVETMVQSIYELYVRLLRERSLWAGGAGA